MKTSHSFPFICGCGCCGGVGLRDALHLKSIWRVCKNRINSSIERYFTFFLTAIHPFNQLYVPLTQLFRLFANYSFFRTVKSLNSWLSIFAPRISVIVHDASIVIGEAIVVNVVWWIFIEVVLAPFLDVFIHNFDIFVPVGAALVMAQADGVEELMVNNSIPQTTSAQTHSSGASWTKSNCGFATRTIMNRNPLYNNTTKSTLNPPLGP